jgi:hypothetical protein
VVTTSRRSSSASYPSLIEIMPGRLGSRPGMKPNPGKGASPLTVPKPKEDAHRPDRAYRAQRDSGMAVTNEKNWRGVDSPGQLKG